MSVETSIKINEGFKGMPYQDTEGFDTIGYGTKLPITEREAGLILKHRLMQSEKQIDSKWLAYSRMPKDVQEMCLEMVYQMGIGGFMKFKKMIQALEKGDYDKAYDEGVDSKWYSQTPYRALKVLSILKDR
jgi:lysozyme